MNSNRSTERLINGGAGAASTHSNTADQDDHATESFSSENSLEYIARKQTRTIAFRRFWGFLGTVMLVLLTVAMLRIWEYKGRMPTSQKTLFGLLSTVLSIALGLNFSEAFKGLAKILRWKILARRKRSIREMELILDSDNFIEVLVLAIESLSIPRILWVCVSWIIVFLCAQAAIAVVSLTYDFDGGSDYNSTYITSGNVNAPDLTCYYHNQTCPAATDSGQQIIQGLAHSYGQLTLSSNCGKYSEMSDVLRSRHYYDYYCRREPGRQEFTHRFSEYSPNDTQRAYPWMSNRTITAHSGRCLTYNEKKSSSESLRRNYTYTNGSYTGWIDIPYAVEDPETTVYIYRGFYAPANAPAQKCGSRCMWMWAHRNFGGGSLSKFYQCPITISNVFNAYKESQNVPDDVAYLAAASIGVNGRQVPNTHAWTQWQFSPFGSPWEIHYKDDDTVGANMAEFAIGSISHMASRNPFNVSFTGHLPHLGQSINVHWQSAIPLLAAIVAGHFLLYAAAVMVSRSVVVKDDSVLAMARLLRPLVDVLGDTGTAMEGKDLSKKIAENPSYKGGVVYGPRKHMGSDEYYLDLEGDIQTADEWERGKHPDGVYR